MKQQTAVEWLGLYIKGITSLNCDEIIEQAKEMEAKQIKLAFTQGELFSGDFYDPNNPKVDCSENYYNETYNQ
jgi:hypothetical protein